MLIRNKKAFGRGMLLLISFLVVFVMFFMPVFPGLESGGEKTNGLVYADHLFNTLSKGSSNFFDATLQRPDSVDKIVDGVKGTSLTLEVPFKDAGQVDMASQLLAQVGLEASASGNGIQLQGELYPLLRMVVDDSFSTYNNNFDEVAGRHDGTDGRKVMQAWWHLLNGMVQPLQKAGLNSQASVVKTVVSKGIEPSYNFYGITPLRVVDNIPLVAGFLIFYVIYTMWYGFAIFELFEGIGLTMKKSAKQEV